MTTSEPDKVVPTEVGVPGTVAARIAVEVESGPRPKIFLALTMN